MNILQEFLDKYPAAPLDDEGVPEEICPRMLGYADIDCIESNRSCAECWRIVEKIERELNNE